MNKNDKNEQTIKNDGPNQRPLVAAAVIASFLMLVFGLGYHVLAARLRAPVNTTPISPDALEGLPLQIGDWTGQDVPLDEDIVRQTDTDAHINRQYSRHGGLESISLYIASGVKARDLAPHRPEVCYTGASWTLIDRDSIELPMDNGAKLPCNILQFSRGALSTEKVIVLDYYIVDGQYCGDLSLLRWKAWRGSGTIQYVAQIQIITTITTNQTASAAKRIISTFAVESASLIAQLFKNNENEQSFDEGDVQANYMFEEAKSG